MMKRLKGTERTRLNIEISPKNWDYLWKLALHKENSMGQELDRILDGLRMGTSGTPLHKINS